MAVAAETEWMAKENGDGWKEHTFQEMKIVERQKLEGGTSHRVYHE
jgi:hypothetical protein